MPNAGGEVYEPTRTRSPLMNPSVARSHAQNRYVTVAAQPQPIALDMAACAVIVVDMQNDFGSEGGMFHRAGIDISMIQRAVTPTRGVLAAARAQGIPIVYLKMAFKADLSDAGPVDSPNYARHQMLNAGTPMQAPDGSASRILVRDTWNTAILEALAPDASDVVLYKHRFSGFFETELDAILRKMGIRHLIVTGCTTSICVEATIRDAMFRDYSCVLLEDCTGEPIGHGLPRSNHDASILNTQVLFGWTSSSVEFLRAVNAVD
jgi:ureidoacrylate peracid hydrolase